MGLLCWPADKRMKLMIKMNGVAVHAIMFACSGILVTY